MKIAEIAEKVFGLTTNVDHLKADVERLSSDVRDLRDRVASLELQGDLTAEKAKNASLQATIEVTQRLSEKMGQLEARVSQSVPQTRIKGD